MLNEEAILFALNDMVPCWNAHVRRWGSNSAENSIEPEKTSVSYCWQQLSQR